MKFIVPTFLYQMCLYFIIRNFFYLISIDLVYLCHQSRLKFCWFDIVILSNVKKSLVKFDCDYDYQYNILF